MTAKAYAVHSTLRYVQRQYVFIVRQHAYACMHSAILLWKICPSVCPSQSGIVSKRMHTSSDSFRHLVAAWF